MPKHAQSTRPVGNPRAVASAVLTDLIDRGRSLNPALEAHGGALADARDRALARELCYGVARWLPRLELCLQRLMDKPLRKRESRVRAVLLLGLYQLMYTRIAEHAAVAESVALVRGAGRDWAAGLVNGVLPDAAALHASVLELAAQIPAARTGCVEVRPVMVLPTRAEVSG